MLLLFLTALSPLAAEETHSWTIAALIRSSLGTAQGQQPGERPDSVLSRDYASLLVDDTQDILTSPLHWDRRDRLPAGGLTGLVATSFAFDRRITEEAQETITPLRPAFTRNAQRLGAEDPGAFETCGYLADDTGAEAVRGLSYDLAGDVGYSRIEQDSEDASDDAVADAIISTAVGRSSVNRHHRTRETLAAYFGGEADGLVLSKNF